MRANEFINEISDDQLQRYLERAGRQVDARQERMARVRDRLNRGYEIYHAETPNKIVHRFEARTPQEAQRYYADYVDRYESDVDYDLRLRRATGLIEARARYEMTDLDPWTFDQTSAGWRSLPTSARQADAIKAYIDAYVKNGQFVGAPEGAKVLRPYILYWHLGQVLTQMGRNVMAVSAMRQALDDGEPGWNAYVMATISFLRQNHKDFDHWAPLARGNEETIKRLTDGWGLPYKQAYAGNKAALRRATGIMEVTMVNTQSKSKREHLDLMPNDGEPIPPGEEADYLGNLVADLGDGYQLWAWVNRGTVTYYVFDTNTRTSQLGTTGRPYASNPDSFVIQGVYSGPRNQYRAADLYAFLILDQGLTLISDNKQSEGGYRVWQELEQRYGRKLNIHGFDTRTDEPVNVTTQDEPDTHVSRADVKRAGPQMKKELGSISRDLRFVASAR
jgi:hypothetical protein